MQQASSAERPEPRPRRLAVRGVGHTLSGTVLSSATSTGVESVEVELHDERGRLLDATTTATGGTYSFSPLADGTYHVLAVGYSVDVTDGIHTAGGGMPCPQICLSTGGDPVVVSGGDVTGIDLSVTPFGTLRGHVQDTLGSPIEGASVDANLAYGPHRGTSFGATDTDASGDFSIAIPPGSYRVSILRAGAHLGESYDDQPADRCEGDVVTVAGGGTIAGIDFELPVGGSISGQVTRASGLSPADVDVFGEDVLGSESLTRSDRTAGDGSYTLEGLGDGRYFVYTHKRELRNEAYDDSPCEPFCYEPPHRGSWIEIVGGNDVTSIDLILGEGDGSISGTVTSALDMSPLFANVELYDGSGTLLDATSTSGGAYSFSDLAPGSYFVEAQGRGFAGQVYTGIACHPSCDPTTGTAVPVAASQDVVGIDLELDPLGSISGQILVGGALPSDLSLILVYDDSGERVTVTGGVSSYTVRDLAAGDYFLLVTNVGAVDELWSGLDCFGGCDPTTGTKITVPAGTDVPNVDFDLSPGGCVAGTVEDAITGLAVEDATLELQLDGTSVTQDQGTDSLGNYLFCGLPAGDYDVFARGVGHLEEQYDEGSATPVSLAGTGVTRDVDFTLARAGSISGRITEEVLTMFGVLERQEISVVEVYDDSGDLVADGVVATGGCSYYRIGPLDAGSYFVRALPIVSDRTPALYDSIPCNACDPTTGTPVPVLAGVETTGIDLRTTVPGLLFAHSFEEGTTAGWTATSP